jgi:hypothetical protein
MEVHICFISKYLTVINQDYKLQITSSQTCYKSKSNTLCSPTMTDVPLQGLERPSFNSKFSDCLVFCASMWEHGAILSLPHDLSYLSSLCHLWTLLLSCSSAAPLLSSPRPLDYRCYTRSRKSPLGGGIWR